MQIAADQLFGCVTERLRSGLVDEGEAAFEVDAVDAVAYRIENQLALAGGHAQRLLGFVLLGYIGAVNKDEGPFSGQLHTAAAAGDAAECAVAAAQRQGALPLFLFGEGAQAILEGSQAGGVEQLG